MIAASQICIAGKNSIAVDALLYLIARGWRDRILVCVNAGDDGRSGWQPSLLRFAREFDVPVVALEQIYPIENMLFISLEFDRIINPKDFKSRRLFNIHFSALPAYKGMYTAALPILNGEVSSGVTLHAIDHGIDTGPILSQRTFGLPGNWTSRDLYLACLEQAGGLFRDTIDLLIDDKELPLRPQAATGSSYFSKSAISYANLKVEMRATAEYLVRQIRAYSFREYQTPTIDGLPVDGGEILERRSLCRPGSIVDRTPSSVTVSTIDYDVTLHKDRAFEWFDVEATTDELYVDTLDSRNINVRNKRGWTPLIVAAYRGDAALCRLLLARGADPDLGNMNGTTPLMYACSGSDQATRDATIRVLVEFGASADLPDKFGRILKDYHEPIDIDQASAIFWA